MIYLTITFVILLLVFNFWNLYNVPIVFTGVKNFLNEGKKKRKNNSHATKKLPKVSIIVPVKNEEKVIGRLLEALEKLQYPEEKKEVIIVNDDSTDRTQEICKIFSEKFHHIRLLTRKNSTTKASALNYGVKFAEGDIIATFDADSVPEPDSLLNAVKLFKDPKVAAVQGRVCSINADESMLTKFLYYEGAVQYDGYIRGKDQLGLFVSLAGTCQFIRSNILEEMKGWKDESLSEDVELSLRLTGKDYKIRYASDVRTWEESPRNLKDLVNQRARWYRGNIELGFKFGVLLKKLSWQRFDAEMTLFGTYIIVACILSYFMAFWSFLLPLDLLTIIIRLTSLYILVILACAGVALVCITKPFKIHNLLWLPFIYGYWGFQSFIALYAIYQVIFRRPRKWTKTSRTGYISEDAKNNFKENNP
jgi:cellulose synthase/poly-beta-1,6-N-acetylglucosamine synthase-like glycosyltransferase